MKKKRRQSRAEPVGLGEDDDRPAWSGPTVLKPVSGPRREPAPAASTAVDGTAGGRGRGPRRDQGSRLPDRAAAAERRSRKARAIATGARGPRRRARNGRRRQGARGGGAARRPGARGGAAPAATARVPAAAPHEAARRRARARPVRPPLAGAPARREAEKAFQAPPPSPAGSTSFATRASRSAPGKLRQAPDLQGPGAFGRVGVCRWRSSAVERLICNQRVGGSIPSASSIAKANPESASHGGCSGRRTGGFLWGGSEAAKRIRL